MRRRLGALFQYRKVATVRKDAIAFATGDLSQNPCIGKLVDGGLHRRLRTSGDLGKVGYVLHRLSRDRSENSYKSDKDDWVPSICDDCSASLRTYM